MISTQDERVFWNLAGDWPINKTSEAHYDALLLKRIRRLHGPKKYVAPPTTASTAGGASRAASRATTPFGGQNAQMTTTTQQHTTKGSFANGNNALSMRAIWSSLTPSSGQRDEDDLLGASAEDDESQSSRPRTGKKTAADIRVERLASNVRRAAYADEKLQKMTGRLGTALSKARALTPKPPAKPPAAPPTPVAKLYYSAEDLAPNDLDSLASSADHSPAALASGA